MKKIFSLLLAGALGFGFVSCQKDSPKTQTEEQTPKGPAVVGTWSLSHQSRGGKLTETYRLTCKADGTYEFRFYRVTQGDHKDDLSAQFNTEETIAGRYSYADGVLTLLSSEFVGYGERFVEARKNNPNEHSPLEKKDQSKGLAFTYDEKADLLRMSRKHSAENIDLDEDIEPIPFTRQK